MMTEPDQSSAEFRKAHAEFMCCKYVQTIDVPLLGKFGGAFTIRHNLGTPDVVVNMYASEPDSALVQWFIPMELVLAEQGVVMVEVGSRDERRSRGLPLLSYQADQLRIVVVG